VLIGFIDCCAEWIVSKIKVKTSKDNYSKERMILEMISSHVRRKSKDKIVKTLGAGLVLQPYYFILSQCIIFKNAIIKL
jgi:hypothetical protein